MAKKKYQVPGEKQAGVESLLPGAQGVVEVEQAFRLEESVRAATSTEALDLADSDLVELELGNGFVLWTTVDRLASDTETGQTRAAGDEFPLRYPLDPGAGERGFISDAIKSFKVLGYDLPRGGAKAVAAKVEGSLEGDGKLFRVSPKGDLFREDPPASDVDRSTLLLLHGTASSTANAFSGFFQDQTATWWDIHDHYEGRVFALDHRTLTKSPVENAIEALEALPVGAKLDLVTHSRGGLVGDLIALGGAQGDAFDAGDVDRELNHAFGHNPELLAAQQTHFQELIRLLADRRPRIGRFVRVACPAAGTTLASDRLDVYFSILVNLITGITGIGPFLGGIGELTAAIAKERTKAEVLPGLEAQRPTSALVRLLNGSRHRLDTDLTVLAGDSDGLIKNLANLFFWRANDLVVDTRSMYGGVPRQRRLWYLEENAAVTHVNYFRRFDTAQVVAQGLTRTEGATKGFSSQVPKGVARGHVDVGEPGAGADLPGVVLLPGIMGSHLSLVQNGRRERVWFDVSDLMKGRGRELAFDSQSTVEADGVLRRPYDKFRDRLASRDVHVMPYAYDWRRSLVEAADGLNELIEKRLEASSTVLHLIGHSMGGLVASLFIVRHPTTWEKLRSREGRLVQVGTPNRGSYVIPRIMQGQEKMVRVLAGLDVKTNTEAWATMVAAFPGILELAPTFDGQKWFEESTWKRDSFAMLAMPTQTDLEAAKKTAHTLRDHTEKLIEHGVLYVAGGPTETPVFDPVSGEIRWTEEGDGRVTWASGIPRGVPTWYVPSKHGSLLNRKKSFDGLIELVLTGKTTRLESEQPPARASLRGVADDRPSLATDADAIAFVPSLDDLEQAALGMDEWTHDEEDRRTEATPCRVSVVHGDLRFCEDPVLVGHYRGDPIVSAEGALDRCLDGALQDRHALGLYPGAVGTADVVLRSQPEGARSTGPSGALVVGLGNVGELTAGGLIRSVEAVLLRYAQACRERGDDVTDLRVSTLLIGSGEAGLTIAQIIEGILLAVGQANRALAKINAGAEENGTVARPPACITHLEFVELYHDVALEALHALVDQPSKGGGFRIERRLVERSGGQRRARAQAPSGWWTRLSIRSTDDEEGMPEWARSRPRSTSTDATEASDAAILHFTAYGERARVAATKLYLQRSLIDRLLDATIRDRRDPDDRLAKTLFELFVPSGLKGSAADQRNLQLVLDEGSAVYPWELLVDGRGVGSAIGIGAGLLRQLRVDDVEVVSHPEENRVLVVGDPPSSMRELPAAVREATEVAATFQNRGWSVVSQIRDARDGISASTIVQALMTHDLRIVHLAGHGVYDAKRPLRSGMVLGGKPGDADDPEVLLTAAEVRQMRLKPELVFINCCHTGRIEKTPYHRLAANLATAFIQAGVKAVVAAGWPVADQAAEVFSQTFYRKLLSGHEFGEAVKEARRRTRDAYPASMTWAAYQCYGDPGYRLLMDLPVRGKVRGVILDDSDYLDSSELVVALGNLRSRAKAEAEPERSEWLAKTAEAYAELIDRKGWRKRPGVLVGLARAWGELGAFERSLALFDEAAGLERGGLMIADIEMKANLLSRWGAKTKDREAIQKSKEIVEGLIARYGSTSERRSLLGSALKRQIQIYEGRSRNRLLVDLREMTRQYILAAEHRASDWTYPATNALLGVLLVGGPWESRPPASRPDDRKSFEKVSWAHRKVFDEQLESVEASLRASKVDKVWGAISPIDLAAIQALAEGGRRPSRKHLADMVDDLAERYRDVFGSYGSRREVDSVINQWRFAEKAFSIVGGTTAEAKAEAFAKLVAALEA